MDFHFRGLKLSYTLKLIVGVGPPHVVPALFFCSYRTVFAGTYAGGFSIKNPQISAGGNAKSGILK